MKNLGLLIAFVLCGTSSLSAQQQQVWHVKLNGTGDGTTWDSATGDLQATLDKAQAGDQVWVAEGIYLPTTTQDRTISFNIKDGIQLFGGFAGTEETLEERDWKEHITVLSGDIGEEKTTEDNSHTVVTFKNVSSNTALDGFVIAEGEAIEGWGDTDDPTSCGAAIFNIADGELSSPIIKNCRFVNNYAFYGAAIYNYSLNQGHCKPVITDSQFENNIAELNGGVIYNSAVDGFAYPVIRNSIFIENIATFGAVICLSFSPIDKNSYRS